MSSTLCRVADISLMGNSHRFCQHTLSQGPLSQPAFLEATAAALLLGHSPCHQAGTGSVQGYVPCRKPGKPVQAGKPLQGHRTGSVSLGSI